MPNFTHHIMLTHRTLIALTTLALPPLAAEEHTIKATPFRIEQSFDASVLPAEPKTFRLDASTWSTFPIESIATHGSTVKKDDTLIQFDREEYTHQLHELERSVALAEIDLAEKQFSLEKLREETELERSAADRAKKQADEDLAYFENTGRPAAKKSVEQSLARSAFHVASAEEELKQLREMYRQDDLTEETEEIILERQEFAVASARHAHNEAKRRADKTLNTELPRQHETLKQSAQQATLALAKAEQNLPRAIQRAEIELRATEAKLAREKQQLADLKQDDSLFTWKAPQDGLFLYGGMDQHRWQLGDLAKLLKPHKSAPTHRPLVTLIPSDATPRFVAWLEPESARTLTTGSAVAVTLPNREDLTLSGKITHLDQVVSTDGKQRVELDIPWPENTAIPWLTTLQCHLVSYENPEAIVIPKQALSPTANGGWSLEVKLADGKTEHREIVTGRANDKHIEVTSGLEPGQVVIIPES